MLAKSNSIVLLHIISAHNKDNIKKIVLNARKAF